MSENEEMVHGGQDAVIEADAREVDDTGQDRGYSSLAPCIIIIFGATGDLTYRKLLPALYGLYINNSMPDSYLIVGCARTGLSHQKFRNMMRGALKDHGLEDMEQWPRFERSIFYKQVEPDSEQAFSELARFLKEIDTERRTRWNRLYYLATPPSAYKSIATSLSRAGLSSEGENGDGWARLVVEKPFGEDLQSSIDLKDAMAAGFSEDQIYRIDHYLAKETVQNLLVFRFANAIFEPLWNRNYIDHIRITAAEKLGVEKRSAYYESAGVLRDMFQNHLMQILALIAMEPPDRFEDERVRDEKIKVFRSLRPFPLENLNQELVLGQYIAGEIDGRKVPAYREEKGVAPDSLTPTFAMMRVFIDNWRWQGAPFFLTSGKRLSRKVTRIVIQFKDPPHSVFRGTLGRISPNRLILSIYPDESITLTFQTKTPGAEMTLRSVTMDFDYHRNYHGPKLDAYEKSIVDAIRGDHMLFWRQDGVEASWRFLDPIISDCETCCDRVKQLKFYEAGADGPQEAQDLIAPHLSD